MNTNIESTRGKNSSIPESEGKITSRKNPYFSPGNPLMSSQLFSYMQEIPCKDFLGAPYDTWKKKSRFFVQPSINSMNRVKAFMERYDPLADFFAGSVAGMAETIALYWTVTWKECRQLNIPMPKSIPGIYAGFPLQMACMIPLFGFMMSVNSVVKKMSKKGERADIPWPTQVGIAAVSGVSATIVNPMEVTLVQKKVREQKAKCSLRIREVVKSVFQERGFRGFWQAATMAALRNVTYSVFVNVCAAKASEEIFNKLPETWEVRVKRSVAVVVAGIFSGAVAGVVSQPFDTVKTRRQADIQNKNFVSHWDAARKIYLQGGLKAFYAGSLPRMIRMAGGAVIVSTIFSSVQTLENQRKKEKQCDKI